MWVVNCVRGKAAICHSHLSAEDHVFVVLMKLRLGLLNKDIASDLACRQVLFQTYTGLGCPLSRVACKT